MNRVMPNALQSINHSSSNSADTKRELISILASYCGGRQGLSASSDLKRPAATLASASIKALRLRRQSKHFLHSASAFWTYEATSHNNYGTHETHTHTHTLGDEWGKQVNLIDGCIELAIPKCSPRSKLKAMTNVFFAILLMLFLA